jgi:hypothetical protein
MATSMRSALLRERSLAAHYSTYSTSEWRYLSSSLQERARQCRPPRPSHQSVPAYMRISRRIIKGTMPSAFSSHLHSVVMLLMRELTPDRSLRTNDKGRRPGTDMAALYVLVLSYHCEAITTGYYISRFDYKASESQPD